MDQVSSETDRVLFPLVKQQGFSCIKYEINPIYIRYDEEKYFCTAIVCHISFSEGYAKIQNRVALNRMKECVSVPVGICP